MGRVVGLRGHFAFGISIIPAAARCAFAGLICLLFFSLPVGFFLGEFGSFLRELELALFANGFIHEGEQAGTAVCAHADGVDQNWVGSENRGCDNRRIKATRFVEVLINGHICLLVNRNSWSYFGGQFAGGVYRWPY